MTARPSLSNCGALGSGMWLYGVLSLFFHIDAAVVVQIGQNFTGSTYGVDTPYTPPDCNGFAGPAQFVELINGRFTVYSKTNGTRLATMTSEDFWTNAGLTFAANVFPTDPRIVYDPSVQRWFASAVDLDLGTLDGASNRFLVAVSTSSDATLTWQGLAFTADPVTGSHADFPTLGLDTNGLYLAAYMFTSANPNAEDLGQTLVSIPKADLLQSSPTADNRTCFGLLGSTNYGYVLQPAVNFDSAASNAAVLAMGDLGYDYSWHSNLVGFSVQNAAGPGSATLTLPENINVDPYYVPINPTQPDGNNTVDDGDARFSANVYQVNGLLYGVHSCQVDGRAALRWYQIDSADFSLLQSGTISDTNLDFFYPSIAANSSGTIVIGFNGCSLSNFVSCFAIIGDSVNGVITFGVPILLQAGLDNYDRSDGRWGDYSTTCVDPVDPNRFWTMQMYPVSSGIWSTQITELLTAVPKLSMKAAGSDVILSWPGTAIAFDLESSSSLDFPDWQVVPQTMSSASKGKVYLRIPTTEGSQFFRLHQH